MNTRFPIVTASLVILLATIVLVGWYLSVPGFIQLNENFVPMQFNTALGFLLAGISLIFFNSNKYFIAKSLASMLFLLSFLTLVQYIFELDLHIDQLFMEAYITTKTPFPGRMSLNTTLCFLAIASAFLCKSQEWFTKYKIPFVTVMGGLVFTAGVFSLAGYLIGYDAVFIWAYFSEMAVHTSAGFMLVGLAVVISMKPQDNDPKPHQLWILYYLTSLMLLSMVLLLLLLKNEERIDQQNLVDLDAENFSIQFVRYLNAVDSRLHNMALRWEADNGTPRSNWEQDSANWLEFQSALMVLAWVDSDMATRWVMSKEQSQFVGINFAGDDTILESLQTSKTQNESYFSKIVDIHSIGKVVLLVHSTFVEGDFTGWIVGLVSIDALVKPYSDAIRNKGYSASLTTVDDVLFYSSASPYQETFALESVQHIELRNRIWQFKLYTNEDFSDLHYSPLVSILFILFGFILATMAWVVRLYFKGQDLIQTEIVLRSAIQSSSTGFIIMDKDGHIQDVNKSLCDWLGYRSNETMGTHMSLLIPEHEKDDMAMLFKNLVEGNTSTIQEKRQFLRKDGTQTWGLLSATAVKLESQNFMSVVMNITDIQEQERLAIQLKEAQNFQNLITDNNPDFIFVEDEEFNIVFANPAFLSLFPEDQRETIIGTTILENFPEDQAKAFMNEAKKAFLEGRSENLETIQFPSGQNRKLFTTRISFENSSGSRFILGVSNDVTQREELIGQLAKSNKDLDQFAYVASHDLKSPLNAIQKIINWIEEDCHDLLPESSKAHFTLLKSRALRMSQLLNDLLQYSRVGRYEYKNETLSLEALCKDVFNLVNLPKKFMYEVAEVELAVPRIPLEIVLRNLVSNAIKHHNKKSGLIKIECDELDHSYILRVSDDGPGIPLDLQTKAITMFQTLQSRDTVEGSGMGLAIVKRIMEHYYGSMKIESDGKAGTTIIIKWPKVNSFGHHIKEEYKNDSET